MITTKGKIISAALLPHPPVMIPEIGGGSCRQCEKTIQGMEQTARILSAKWPDTVLIISPHGPMFRDGPCFLAEDHLTGNMESFGYPSLSLEGWNDKKLLELIGRELTSIHQNYLLMDEQAASQYGRSCLLDHGFLIPFWYIQKEFQPRYIISMTYGYQDGDSEYEMGQAIRNAIEKSGRRVAVVASGDMSHRLSSVSPYGYDPAGPAFDRKIEHFLSEGDWSSIRYFPESISEAAGECGLRSLQVLAGIIGGHGQMNIFSHESPFGIGYMTGAVVLSERGKSSPTPSVRGRKAADPCCLLAKETVTARVTKQPFQGNDYGADWLHERGACFVTLYKDQKLRGCVGTLFPMENDLIHEIMENASEAALKDPRFPPVTPEELPQITYTVDILSELEEVMGTRKLDPQRYGIVVLCEHRTGLVLPRTHGADTARQQLNLALQKGHIGPDEPYRILRFRSICHK